MNGEDDRVCSMGTPGCFCDATIETAFCCAWCGKMKWRSLDDTPVMACITSWCSNECYGAHRAANPKCDHFAKWQPIADTLPGGAYDGVWENSKLTFGGRAMSDTLCENFRPEHNFKYTHVEQVPDGNGANMRSLYVVICSRCGEVRKVEPR